MITKRSREPSGMFLAFRLGEQQLAVAASQVVRVAELESLHPLPGDLECNLGLAVHDGIAIGLLDLEIMLSLRASRRPSPWPKLPFPCVFGRFARGIAGFPVDELLGLERHVSQERIIDLSIQEALR